MALADGAPIEATATTTMTGVMDADPITPAQFLAELEAAGTKTGDDAPVGDKPPAEGEKPDAPVEGEKPAEVDPNGDKPDAAKVEAKPEEKVEERPPEAKPTDSDEVKKARKIYSAAARKEAAALKLEQENKSLKGTLEQLAKLRDEDALAFLESVGFGKGAEKDPVKDLLARIVAKGESKPELTAEERVAALEKRLADEKVERDKRDSDAVTVAAKARIAAEVKAAGDKYDLVNAFEDYEGVTDVMEAYYEAHGVACGTEFAAAAREKYHQDRLAKSTKFKAPAGAPAALAAKPATTSTGTKPASTAMGKSETLTNTDSGSKVPEDDLPFDDHDARAKAAARGLGLGFTRN